MLKKKAKKKEHLNELAQLDATALKNVLQSVEASNFLI